MVTAADYSEMETYTVTVTRAAGEGTTLLSMYDADGDELISTSPRSTRPLITTSTATLH